MFNIAHLNYITYTFAF